VTTATATDQNKHGSRFPGVSNSLIPADGNVSANIVPLDQVSITVTGALLQAEYRLYAKPSPPATGFSPITAIDSSSPSGQSRILKFPKLGHGVVPAGIVVEIVWDELIVEVGADVVVVVDTIEEGAEVAADEVVDGVYRVVSTTSGELLVEVLVE
jgi:hypothetical protein